MSNEGALIREGKALGLLIVPEYMWEMTDFEVQLDKTLNIPSSGFIAYPAFSGRPNQGHDVVPSHLNYLMILLATFLLKCAILNLCFFHFRPLT